MNPAVELVKFTHSLIVRCRPSCAISAPRTPKNIKMTVRPVIASAPIRQRCERRRSALPRRRAGPITVMPRSQQRGIGAVRPRSFAVWTPSLLRDGERDVHAHRVVAELVAHQDVLSWL